MSESNNNVPMRITQLPEATAYEEGMYYAVAKAGAGTKKISVFADRNNNIEINKIINKLEKSYPTNYNYLGVINPFVMPDNEFDAFNINIYSDEKNYFSDFDITSKKNEILRTFYISPNGNDSNNGLTQDTPKKTIKSMTNSILDGDTFILLNGVYDRETLPNDISKNINIIAQNSKKASVVFSDNNYIYTKNTSYNNVWETSRSNVQSILFKFDDNCYKRLKAASAINYVDSTPFSFYNSGGTLYINVGSYTPTNDNTMISLALNKPVVNVSSSSQNVKLYLEGIKFFGGSSGTVLFQNSSTYKESALYAKDCEFLGGYGTNYNAVSMLGCDSIFVNCKAAYADRDGFNYHAQNGETSKNLEINCCGFCNGATDESNNNNNGSTAHDGCIVIRINCLYYGNKGPNIMDTAASIGSKSLNLHCVAFDSLSSQDAMNNDIRNGDDVECWIYGCKFLGSKYNLYNPTGSIMHLKNTIYDNKNGGGQFIDD